MPVVPAPAGLFPRRTRTRQTLTRRPRACGAVSPSCRVGQRVVRLVVLVHAGLWLASAARTG